jgi:hypothetical protein
MSHPFDPLIFGQLLDHRGTNRVFCQNLNALETTPQVSWHRLTSVTKESKSLELKVSESTFVYEQFRVLMKGSLHRDFRDLGSAYCGSVLLSGPVQICILPRQILTLGGEEHGGDPCILPMGAPISEWHAFCW